MNRIFGFVDVDTQEIIEKMSEQEYEIYSSLFFKSSYIHGHNDTIDSFRDFFNTVFYVSGKPRYDVLGRRQKPIALIEIIPITNNSEEVEYRIISADEMFANRRKDIDDSKWELKFTYGKPRLKYEFRRPRYSDYYDYEWNKHDLTNHRWLTESPSFREAKYRHDLLELDDKFYAGNDEPLARRPKNGIDGIYNRSDRAISQKANWKNISKDKYQWQHNLRGKGANAMSEQNDNETPSVFNKTHQPPLETKIKYLKKYLSDNSVPNLDDEYQDLDPEPKTK